MAILLPQHFFYHGGRSSAGRAPGCGPGCRGFKPVAHPIFPKYNSRYGSKLQHHLEPLFEGELVEHGAVFLTYVGLDDSRLRRYGPFKLKMVK